jgi:methionyl-tRNA formyltransferase
VVDEVEQDHDAATFAPKIDRETARIDWDRDASDVALHVRAMDPVPGAWAKLDEAPIKVFRPSVWSPSEVAALGTEGARTNGGPRDGAGGTPSPQAGPGTVVRAAPEDGVVVSAGSGGVSFAEVQPPGKRRMSAADWINGRGVETGQRFE